MSVVALTVPLELSDAGALIPISPGGGAGNGTVFAVDTAGYNSISVQVGGVWNANLTFQTSNDGATWVNTQGFAFNSSVNAIDTVVDNDVYLVPVIGRYFRLVMSNYTNGLANITAYLRFQSIAGLGEAMMSQAMDKTTGTPVNVTFQGVQGPGQQPSANSVPVTLSNENIQDKFITGRAFTQTSTYLNYNMLLDAADSGFNPGAPLDCLQYRSIYFQFNSGGAAGLGNAVNATFLPEASNDLVNWTNVAVFSLGAAITVGGSEITSFNPSNYGNSATFGANLMMRYFRVRCSGFSSTVFIQFTTTLRMTPFLHRVETFTNIGQQGASSLAQGVAQFNSGSQTVSVGLGSAMSSALPPLIIGGTDRSIVRQEFLGAPVGATPTYGLNGPWTRQAYFDTAGNMGVAGPQPFLAEDKTYPVNVRLERSTSGQDSVQDLLQQILVELKLNNHYTKETPLALATSNFSSMEDNLSDFVNDKTLYN